ncbi:MAG: GNAT family N-acetyltransferase [Pseudomonadota bacterium]|nr:GNAT family N-acetyltransferase [Pseudomonadota bacterium]
MKTGPRLREDSLQNLGIRDAVPTDFGIICALNLAEVRHTSLMDLDRLADLDALSSYHKVACVGDTVAGFVLALRDGAAYRNDNYEWFAGKYPRFLYIDRSVTSSESRGLRLGSLLYEDIFRYARSEGIPWITCEYNIVPPNERSRLFHDKFGFHEQATQWVANGTKRVSLQVAETGHTSPNSIS